jgi:hypothetical protein
MIFASDAIPESNLLQQLTSDSAEPAAESLSPEPSTESDSKSAAITLTPDQLQTAIGSAIETALAPMQQQLTETTQQLQQVQQQKDSLEQVFKVIGKPVNFNTIASVHADRTEGLATDFIQAVDSAPAEIWYDKQSGQRIVQRDLSDARHLFLTQRDQLRRDMEKHAKQHGLLMGGRRMSSDSATERADISPALLAYLSLTMRETHRGRYVWWQFPMYELELGKGPRDTIQVARLRWLAEPTSVADRTLTPGTPLNLNRQNITITSKSIVLGERGLGKAGVTGAEPVAIPEFLSAYSMVNLENAVMKVLGHDYEAFEDLSIRSRAFASTRVIYNSRGNVTTNPSAVVANSDGTLSENFVNNAYAYASGQQFPTYDDGCYIWVVHDIGVAQLKNSLSSKQQYIEKRQMEEITEVLIPASNREQGKVSGYAGTVGGFHFFATNAHSMGAAGTEGAQNETLGTGASILTRASFILGQGAIARAVGMEAEIRRDNNDDFQRMKGFSWLSHETTDSLDVDPAINAEEQLRVLEVRTIDTPL